MRDVIINGDSPSIVYVYDGAPIRNVKVGETIYMDASSKRTVMTSKATGTTWDSIGGHGVPLYYYGKPVGFLPTNSDKINAMLKNGRSVKVAVKRVGTYMPGIPEMKAMLPSRKTMGQLADSVSEPIQHKPMSRKTKRVLFVVLGVFLAMCVISSLTIDYPVPVRIVYAAISAGLSYACFRHANRLTQ